MKLLIAGSRGLISYRLIRRVVNKIVAEQNYKVLEVISGGARGVDTLAEEYADEFGLIKTIKKADWDLHGKSAGYKRNVEMGEEADVAIVLILDDSKGSTHMVNIMKRLGKPVHAIYFKSNPFRVDKQEGFNLGSA